MALLLGVDTGGTYTDAVVLDDARDSVLASAKSLTTRPDLALGIGRAIDAALMQAAVNPSDISMVSLSTTLATNALVEGQGGRVALVFIGFGETELTRSGLQDALAGDPVIALAGGHSHSGGEVAPLDIDGLRAALADHSGVTAYAVAASFGTRNPAHEVTARDLIRELTGKPVTCAHELSSALGGPKRALTAVLNARLIGMIDRLITACETHLAQIGVDANLMVVRGDGALVISDMAREKPIETILSGPAASVAGASWLSGEADALVSDIGGTTTDICLLRDGRPMIDPEGARVGPYRTMVEAVAMRTHGLGGDSAVHVSGGLKGGLFLGPRRLMPVSLLAVDHPELVHADLDHALNAEMPSSERGQYVCPLWEGDIPEGLEKREADVAQRLQAGPQRMASAVSSRLEASALARMVSRGLVVISGVTPSDASHVLGLSDRWDVGAAQKAMQLFAKQRNGAGERIAQSAEQMAQMILDQLHVQTVDCLLETAFAEDDRDWGQPSTDLARHALTVAGLDRHQGIVQTQLSIGIPVIGLGASAASYYGPVGARLGTKMVLPEHGDVANAIGAVVGQVSMQIEGSITGSGPGTVVAHLSDGPKHFADHDAAIKALEADLIAQATVQAEASGVVSPQIAIDRDIKVAAIEGSEMFIGATLKVTASGRPRIAVS